MKKLASARVTLTVKDSSEFGNLADALGLSETDRNEFFEFGEYATLELEIDSALKIVGGRVVPVAEL